MKYYDSFSIIHALAYSFIGMQTLYLATNFNPIYWNTAYLIVNSGSLDEESAEQTDYTKLAKAIGEIRSAGIKVSLVDINESDFGFKPDAKNNQILFGLKGVININNDCIKTITENRSYVSIIDFINKVNPKKQAMIALIKGGAFDQFVTDRREAMVQYLWLTCDKKRRLTLQNIPSLIKYKMIPNEESLIEAKSIYEFNRYLKDQCKFGDHYKLTERAIDFLNSRGFESLYSADFCMDINLWNKTYQIEMDVFRDWISENKDKILDDLNTMIFMEEWDKYARGNISSWEMEALCFYYHEHELANINNQKYGIVDFSNLPEEPVVDKVFRRNKVDIPIYKLSFICGTCIAKNKTKATVYLLTTKGVVPVKFRNEYFALFDKQVSQLDPSTGKKRVVEKSWFNRGNMIMIQGIRRGDEFVAKKYSSSRGHQLYHIDQVLENGDLVIRSERKQGEIEDEEI